MKRKTLLSKKIILLLVALLPLLSAAQHETADKNEPVRMKSTYTFYHGQQIIPAGGVASMIKGTENKELITSWNQGWKAIIAGRTCIGLGCLTLGVGFVMAVCTSVTGGGMLFSLDMCTFVPMGITFLTCGIGAKQTGKHVVGKVINYYNQLSGTAWACNPVKLTFGCSQYAPGPGLALHF